MIYLETKKNLPVYLGVGLSERIIEIPWTLSHLTQSGNHLDAGSSFNFWYILGSKILRDRKVFIVNLNPEKNNYISDSVSYIYDDLRRPIFVDGFFQSISCVSVLEHIGMDNSTYVNDAYYKQKRMKDFSLVIKEFSRMLSKNGICLLTVPFGVHEDRGWFQIFDKKMISTIIKVFSPLSFDISYYKYGDSGWHLSTEEECKDIRHSLQYPGNTYCAASQAIACIKLVK